MDTLLDALQEGRLFELPDNDKPSALQFLAHIIEAFPDIPAETDIFERILANEKVSNSSLIKGWACPHARVPFDGDLMCAIGWSPTGVDYKEPDKTLIHLIVMYMVPSNQRNHYLREISILAKALDNYPSPAKLHNAQDLDDIRNYVLDLIDSTKEMAVPDARARMIRLMTTPEVKALSITDLSNLIIEPVKLVVAPGAKTIVLTQNADLAKLLDKATGLSKNIENNGIYQCGEWRLIRHSVSTFHGEKFVYDCLAIHAATTSKLK
jgi:mannitol/fructose-specific phosphotransferase system IIA component (Ntr-type)